LIGEFLSGKDREEFVISSKYGRTHLFSPHRSTAGIHRRSLVAEVENSLRRLRTDHIDLYFPHFDDGVTPIDEIMRGLDDLVRAGKILYIGLSNFPA
jgi:aryl-alcohol dehydrogenase-like predicted oxidoreductase